MYRDPSVYLMLSLDTNLECTYGWVGLYDEEEVLVDHRERKGRVERIPLDALDAMLSWAADHLNSHYSGEQLIFDD